jgi:hypothetical protein
MLVCFRLAPSNAAQQKLFRNANHRNPRWWRNEISATSFRVEPGAVVAAPAVLARIIVEAPEQLEHIRRQRFVGGCVIILNRFPDLHQHDVPEVRRWPVAALGSH